jgi:hypothetical protein
MSPPRLWFPEQENFLLSLYSLSPRPSYATMHQAVNERFGTNFSLTAIEHAIRRLRPSLKKESAPPTVLQLPDVHLAYLKQVAFYFSPYTIQQKMRSKFGIQYNLALLTALIKVLDIPAPLPFAYAQLLCRVEAYHDRSA